ncbi:hypothetical protein KY334_05590 [Candidatus Woesearchaeota archaeon]|nr:hypothetical protein [Candidatus Woesearchaeota archaeon]
MIEIDMYHTSQEFDELGLEPLIEHIKEYKLGLTSLPVCKSADNMDSRQIKFTFSDVLMEHFLNDSKKMKKPYEVSIKYGFRNYSLGEKNGVFYLRNSDNGLNKAIPKLTKKHIDEIVEDLKTEEEKIYKLKPVKIVWHNPCGVRIVGLYDDEKSKAIFLDFAKY